jgi:electron transfer flavoprotein alpha subunit
LGLSGTVQHLAGMKNARCVVAVNRDPDAPIFAAADWGLVADIYEVVPDWIAKLRAAAS